LTLSTLRYLAGNEVANAKYFWLHQIATPYAGGLKLSGIASILSSFQIKDRSDAQRYLSLLHQYAAFVHSMGDVLKEQHRRGIILPNVESDASAAVFLGYAKLASAGTFSVADARLHALASSERSDFHARSGTIVSSELAPALKEVAAYLNGSYREFAPRGVGLSQYPGGREYYQYLIFASTTLTTTPAALHATGLREMEKLNAQLDAVRKEVHFFGSLRSFKHFLATSPQFFPKTTPQFGERLELYVRRSAQAAPSFFLHLPKTPYDVEPLPKALAGSQTFGYYNPPTAARPKGSYLYNAWHPERTSALGAGALICHELIPGHHFQIALQQENTTLPEVRHYDFSETGFLEGWGEYASQLCWDMGVYRTPYDRAGRLMQDLMSSTRLVVDTGMNSMGWSLQRGRAFMRENLTITESQINSESLRYSTDLPGQALAYKSGELAMLDIRADAKRRLGKSFDIRRFHSWLLDSGSMTLDTLRAHVNYEIEQAKKPAP
ncbi:MAG: DUF885 domain-containing protein, partial [Candidatus Eremiobacteraeota bacterium]|nr:DUF885 domain-containing protein [Candidatus Eremiobacteraeota bacterium]